MENAAKALSMAASVLIGVLLIALLVIAYYRFIAISQREEANTKVEQTAEFNKRYEAYNRQNLKGNQLVSLCNMVVDNNIKYEGIQDYQIYIEVAGEPSSGIDGFNSDTYNSSMRETIKKYTYKCTGVERNGRDGRISKMTFEPIE